MIREVTKLDTTQKRLIVCLLALLFVFAGLYVYLVNQTVVHVVQRRALEGELGGLRSRVSTLERTHLELESTITTEYARTLGFKELAAVSYVSRDPLALSVDTLSTQ